VGFFPLFSALLQETLTMTSIVLPEEIEPPLWFTRRERETLLLLCTFQSNKQMAAELGISIPTVKTHITLLLRKLDLFDRTELIGWALQHEEGVLRGFTRDRELHESGCACEASYCLGMRRIRGQAPTPQPAFPAPIAA
jgi:DNA-binding CsgD family transcriptional regulator